MSADRGVAVDHTTIFRWIQAYAPELDKRLRPHLRMTTGSWRVDETDVKVKGRWVYLYRAVDGRGQTINFRFRQRSRQLDHRGGAAVEDPSILEETHALPALPLDGDN